MIIQALVKSSDALVEGKSFVDCLKQQGIFSKKILQPLRVFERTNRLVLLQKLVHRNQVFCKNELGITIRMASQLIMIILGILVGTLIIGMYLPIFSMGAAVG